MFFGNKYYFSTKKAMAILFLSYFLTMGAVVLQKKKLAIFLFVISTLSSIGMFFYHTTSSLNLNF